MLWSQLSLDAGVARLSPEVLTGAKPIAKLGIGVSWGYREGRSGIWALMGDNFTAREEGFSLHDERFVE